MLPQFCRTGPTSAANAATVITPLRQLMSTHLHPNKRLCREFCAPRSSMMWSPVTAFGYPTGKMSRSGRDSVFLHEWTPPRAPSPRVSEIPSSRLRRTHIGSKDLAHPKSDSPSYSTELTILPTRLLFQPMITITTLRDPMSIDSSLHTLLESRITPRFLASISSPPMYPGIHASEVTIPHFVHVRTPS